MKPRISFWRAVATVCVVLGSQPLIPTAAASRGDTGFGDAVAPSASEEWESRGGIITSAPDVVWGRDDNLFYFARGQDNAIWMQEVDPGGQSLGWSSLGGRAKGGPGASVRSSFFTQVGRGIRIDVFVRGLDDALWYRTYFEGDNEPGFWTGWSSLGGRLSSDPAAVAFFHHGASSELHVFGRGTDGALWHRRAIGQDCESPLPHPVSSCPVSWEPWSSLGGQMKGGPGTGGDRTGGTNIRGVVAVRGLNDSVWYRSFDFDEFGGNPFGPWLTAGGVLTADPDVEPGGTGGIPSFSLYGRGTDNAIWYAETEPHSGWQSLGGLSRSRASHSTRCRLGSRR